MEEHLMYHNMNEEKSRQLRQWIAVILLALLMLGAILLPVVIKNVNASPNFGVYGYITDSGGNQIPSDVTVTITDITTGSSGTTTTYTDGGFTNKYSYNLYDLASCNDGDTITVNCSYSGETGSCSFVLDTTAENSHNCTFQLSEAPSISRSGANLMQFPDTGYNSGQWVNASSNLLQLTNNGGEIDGSSTWVAVLPAWMKNLTHDELIAITQLYVQINSGSWYNITETDGNGMYNISDNIWDYTFSNGDTMTIKQRVYIQDCAGCDPAGYYRSYLAGMTDIAGRWQIKSTSGNLTTGTEPDAIWNATITLTSTGNDAPKTPHSPSPANNSEITAYNPSLSFYTGDNDSSYIECKLYINGSLENTKYVESPSSDQNVSIDAPLLETNHRYSWYITVDDGADMVTGPTWYINTTGAGGTMAPILYNPSPSHNASNVSLLPTLSIWVHDNDSDNPTVAFYNSDDEAIGYDTVDLSSGDTGKASVQWNDVTTTEQTYEWYVIANDHSGNTVRYPSSGLLNFTTAKTYPPSSRSICRIAAAFHCLM